MMDHSSLQLSASKPEEVSARLQAANINKQWRRSSSGDGELRATVRFITTLLEP